MISSADGLLLLTAWATGFLGGTHCIGMCGGISAAFSFALPAEARKGGRLLAWQLAYNTGRLLTYTLLGLSVGLLAYAIPGNWAHSIWPRLLAGSFMVFLGLYLAGWNHWLQRIESVGSGLWKILAPLRQKIFPINHPLKALLAGGIWGLLPCGLVYSALTLAMTRSDPMLAAATMLAFGLGTLPTLLVTGTLAGKLRLFLQGKRTRQISGILVIIFGIITIAAVFSHSHDEHSTHKTTHEQPHENAHEAHLHNTAAENTDRSSSTTTAIPKSEDSDHSMHHHHTE